MPRSDITYSLNDEEIVSILAGVIGGIAPIPNITEAGEQQKNGEDGTQWISAAVDSFRVHDLIW